MLKRIYQILGVLFFCFYERVPLSFLLLFFFFPYRKLLAFSPPERLRLALENLGPTFIKLGQLLSTRVDLLPPSYIKELQKLQDQVPPVPLELLLTPEIKENFKEISKEPIGSGSIAQVHKGILKDGREVAVKFLKPNVKKLIKRDMKVLRTVLFLLSFYPLVRELKLRKVADEIETILLDEVDLSREASYLEMFKRFSEKEGRLYVPSVIWEVSSEKVLVTEFIRGKKLLDYLKVHGNSRKLAGDFVNLVNRMVFEFRVFHGDLHPGNVFITDDGRIALVDFGIVGRLTPETASHFFLFSLGVMERDADLIVEALERIEVLPKNVNLVLLKREIVKFLDKYYNRPLSSIDAEKIFYEELSAARKFRIVLPEELVILMKTIAHTESIARIIYPDFRLPPVLKPYLKKLLPRFVLESAKRKFVKNSLLWERAFEEVPKKLTEKGKEDYKGISSAALILGVGIVLAFKPWMLIPYFLFYLIFSDFFKR